MAHPHTRAARARRATSPSSWTATAAGPRAARCRGTLGHRAGVKAVRATVEDCARRGVEALTLFAFSQRELAAPADEVARLMELFIEALEREVDDLHANGMRLRFIGDLHALRARAARARWPRPRSAPRQRAH